MKARENIHGKCVWSILTVQTNKCVKYFIFLYFNLFLFWQHGIMWQCLQYRFSVIWLHDLLLCFCFLFPFYFKTLSLCSFAVSGVDIMLHSCIGSLPTIILLKILWWNRNRFLEIVSSFSCSINISEVSFLFFFFSG